MPRAAILFCHRPVLFPVAGTSCQQSYVPRKIAKRQDRRVGGMSWDFTEGTAPGVPLTAT